MSAVNDRSLQNITRERDEGEALVRERASTEKRLAMAKSIGGKSAYNICVSVYFMFDVTSFWMTLDRRDPPWTFYIAFKHFQLQPKTSREVVIPHRSTKVQLLLLGLILFSNLNRFLLFYGIKVGAGNQWRTEEVCLRFQQPPPPRTKNNFYLIIILELRNFFHSNSKVFHKLFMNYRVLLTLEINHLFETFSP